MHFRVQRVLKINSEAIPEVSWLSSKGCWPQDWHESCWTAALTVYSLRCMSRSRLSMVECHRVPSVEGMFKNHRSTGVHAPCLICTVLRVEGSSRNVHIARPQLFKCQLFACITLSVQHMCHPFICREQQQPLQHPVADGSIVCCKYHPLTECS